MEESPEVNRRPLISAIIPVFNTGQYLERCITSFVSQTYQNMQIILVDDGSTDGSGELCDKWANRDERILVVHKENGGVSSARNLGMKLAEGDYIGFEDSDDWAEPCMYEVLLGAIERTGADIAECNWDCISGTIEPNDTSFSCAASGDIMPIPKIYSPEDAIGELIDDGTFRQTVTNKLYKREVIAGVYFPENLINEDEFWTYQVFGQAKRLAKIEVVLEHYYQRENSLIHEQFSLDRLAAVKAKEQRIAYVEKHFPTLTGKAKCDYASTCFYQFQAICRTKGLDSDKAIRRNLYQRYCGSYGALVERTSTTKQRCWRRAFRKAPFLISRIRNLLGIGI